MNYSCDSILFSWKVYAKSTVRCAVQFCVTVSRLSLFSSPLQAVYMFYALAIVCDDFFVPSLEKICEVSVRCSFPMCCFHSSSGEPWGVVMVYLLWSCSVACAACLVAQHDVCALTQLCVPPCRTGSPGAPGIHAVVVAVASHLRVFADVSAETPGPSLSWHKISGDLPQ